MMSTLLVPELSQNDSTSLRNSENENDSEDESEVVEESPCGRWQKRPEEVKQRDVPGIDLAFLAMDTEEGVEVVWNEVQISEKKSKSQLDKIKLVFDNLIQLEHPNIVKFHKYWTDIKYDRPRVVFITEYMSSGSLKQFLKKTKLNNRTLKAWKRWCTQILSALSYLHSCKPPIIHGNLTCDTIFIQHNGLIKIGSVAPDAIHSHVKTFKEEPRNMHYVAPEYGNLITPAVDIYSFGMCTLQMATLELSGNGDLSNNVSDEVIKKALASLENRVQRDFISLCLENDPKDRPTARELLFHAVLFEVHSLKLLAAHVHMQRANIPEHILEESYQSKIDPKKVIASITHTDGREPYVFTVEQANLVELEKFCEDVNNGIYPLTAFAVLEPTLTHGRKSVVTPDVIELAQPETIEYSESRKLLTCSVTIIPDDEATLHMTILVRMEDKMNRQLQGKVTVSDDPETLANELVHYGFICADDKNKLASEIEESMKRISLN